MSKPTVNINMFSTHKVDKSKYQKDFQYKKITSNVYLIPGENPGNNYLINRLLLKVMAFFVEPMYI